MLRIGTLGTGGIINKHIGALAKSGDAEIVALCDVNPDAIETAKAAHFEGKEIGGYTDSEEMLANENLDAVIIATPHTLHYGHAVQALDAGCHVFLEKPMTTSSKDAYKLAEKAKEVGKVVAVGYNTSSKQVFQYLREQIRNKTYGSLEMVTGYISQNWMKGTAGKWRQIPELSGGGQAYDSGAHILNSLLWSVESEPEMVFAFTDNKDCLVDINSVMSVRFANGVLANITIGGNCAFGGRFMAFVFEGGVVEIDGWGGNWMKVKVKGLPEEPEFDIPEVTPIDNFVDAILGKTEVAAGLQNGINHSLLMEGIYASARLGQPVNPAKLEE
ncbi:MAG: Gfo/Idh/MocA family oxidoreductase [Candidatus Latescibacteria bacterium]|jgi:predicted dehydrogenase|nr:Gfo/Idh/MocA family oxidoreductase [Candidatus Latescibacterota bacterium]